MLERQDQDERADADSLGLSRDRGGRRQQRRIVAVVGEVVLREPAVVVAELFGAAYLPEDRTVELARGAAPGQ